VPLQCQRALTSRSHGRILAHAFAKASADESAEALAKADGGAQTGSEMFTFAGLMAAFRASGKAAGPNPSAIVTVSQDVLPITNQAPGVRPEAWVPSSMHYRHVCFRRRISASPPRASSPSVAGSGMPTIETLSIQHP